MKIAAFLDSKIDGGGGFNQSLNAILQMRDIAENKFDFIVVTTVRDNVQHLKRLGIQADYFKCSITDKLLSLSVLNRIARRIQARLKWIGSLEWYLLQQHVDVVYFLSPSIQSISLQKLNYMITVWDLCHRDTPEFPEVRSFNQFFAREEIYNHCLTPALIVLADSQTLKDRIVDRYGVDRDRIIPMPFSPSPFLEEDQSSREDVLQKYVIDDDYFFYPAQFWAHKNHVRVLEALSLLNEKGKEYQVVFCGSDQGNLSYVQQFIANHGLTDQVKILGFVPESDMRGLYQHCMAVVMPTYFGPTNLPPLEAWSLGKPLIYSDSFKEQVGDAAICINPDSAEELAEAMQEIAESSARRVELAHSGTEKLKIVAEERAQAEKELQAVLLRFEKRRRCWQ